MGWWHRSSIKTHPAAAYSPAMSYAGPGNLEARNAVLAARERSTGATVSPAICDPIIETKPTAPPPKATARAFGSPLRPVFHCRSGDRLRREDAGPLQGSWLDLPYAMRQFALLEILTERLVLRRPRLEDVSAIVLACRDPDVPRFMPEVSIP